MNPRLNEDSFLEGLRVLLVAQYSDMGGTRTYFKQLVQFYLQQGAQIAVIRLGPKNDRDMDEYLGTKNISQIVFPSHTETTKTNWFPVQSRLTINREIQRETEIFRSISKQHQSDLLVASVGNPGSLLGALSAVERSIYIVHTYPHGIRSFLSSRQRMPKAIPETASLVTVSEYARSRLIKAWRLDGRKKSVSVLYSTAGSLTSEPSRPGPSHMVLTSGHVEDYKDPLGWIEIAATVRSQPGLEATRFVWVGDGSLLSRCRRLVKQRGLENHVEFVGFKSDLQTYYENCSVYVQPSRVESLGLSVLDAARHGIPAVVTNVGGLPEIVESGTTGFVYPVGKHLSAAHLISSLLIDSNERERMGSQARRKYVDQFSLESWSAGLLDIHLET